MHVSSNVQSARACVEPYFVRAEDDGHRRLRRGHLLRKHESARQEDSEDDGRARETAAYAKRGCRAGARARGRRENYGTSAEADGDGSTLGWGLTGK